MPPQPPQTQQATPTPQQAAPARQENREVRELPDYPLPESNINYSKVYNDTERNAAYYSLFSANLPTSLRTQGQYNIAVVELPKALATQAGQENTFMGTNAILAATLRGYQEQIKEKDIKFTIVAQDTTKEPGLEVNKLAITTSNLVKIMREAFGERLDPDYQRKENVLTFSLNGGNNKIEITLFSADGGKVSGSTQLVAAAQQTKPNAMIVLGHTTQNTINIQLTAEEPRTAADPNKGVPITNTSVQTAIRAGVVEELRGQIPITGLQRIAYPEIDSEKYKTLQNAFKMGYRFVGEEVDGKQTIRIFKINTIGVGEELAKVEVQAPDLANYDKLSKDRAEKLFNVVSKLMAAEPVPIISNENVPPISLRGQALNVENVAETSLGIVKKGFEAGYNILHSGTKKTESGEVETYQIFKTIAGKKMAIGAPIELAKQGEDYLEKRDKALADAMTQVVNNPPYEFTNNGNLIALVDRKAYPEIVKLLESGDLRLDSISPVTAALKDTKLELYNYSYKYKDASGQEQVQPIVLSSSNHSIESLNSVIDAIANKKQIEIMATAEPGKYYMLPVSTKPLDAGVLQEARSLGYEIVDLGQKGNERTFGLRNLTTYELVPTAAAGKFEMKTGKIDLTFAVSNAGVDGELGKELDKAITADAENAKLRAQQKLRAELSQEQRQMRTSGLNWHPDAIARVENGLRNIEETAGPSVGDRSTEYLTRRNTNATIDTIIETRDLHKLMENGAALVKGGDQERSRRTHTGMEYRYSDAFGQVLSQVAIERGLGEEFATKIRQSDMAIFDTVAVSYLRNKEAIDVMLNAGDQKEAQARLERLALAAAQIVIDKREQNQDRLIAGPNTRVVAILGGDLEFSSAAVKASLAHYGVKPEAVFTDKDRTKDNKRYGANELIEYAMQQDPAKGESLIHIWGHTTAGGFTHINSTRLAESVILNAKPKVAEDGNVVLDLGHVNFMFEGCLVGGFGGIFYQQLEAAAQAKNMKIAVPPNMYSSVQRNEYSRNALAADVRSIDGQQRPSVPLSLLQEAMVALPKTETGFTRKHLFEVAERLQDGFTAQAANYELEYKPKEPPYLRLDLGQQSPVVFDATPTPMIKLFQMLEEGMNSEQIKKSDEGVIRLPVPKDQGELTIHLSSLENTNNNVNS